MIKKPFRVICTDGRVYPHGEAFSVSLRIGENKKQRIYPLLYLQKKSIAYR